jgi:uncharacterized membrane protein YfcA
MFIIESSDTTNAPAAASLGAIGRCYDHTVHGLDAFGFLLAVGGALVGAVVGGVAGFGAGITLLPILTLLLGARTAIPILTVTMLIGNLARLWWSRHDVNGRVVLAFLAGAVPATAAGALLFAGASSDHLSRLIGTFMLASLPLRRILNARGFAVRLGHFPALGVAIGALSSIVVTTGPVLTPFFLAYGLRRAAYIGTESACAMAMHVTRGTVFARYSLLTWEAVTLGCVLGGTMFLGTWMARRLLEHLSERTFLWIVEGMLVVMGLQFLLFPR